jgi:hypothetical protein
LNEPRFKSRNDMEAFVAAVNCSRISSLSLTFNDTLHDQFLTSFRCYYPPSRYLRHISLSGIDYTLDELSIPCAALNLLPLARMLMLCTSGTQLPSTPGSHASISNATPQCHGRAQHKEPDPPQSLSTCAPISHAYSALLVTPSWQSLPVELQLHIFQYFASILSFSQTLRVVNYAADPSTLFGDDRNIAQWLELCKCNSG